MKLTTLSLTLFFAGTLLLVVKTAIRKKEKYIRVLGVVGSGIIAVSVLIALYSELWA